MQVITLLIALFNLLSKILDRLTYIEGQKEARKAPEYIYNENYEKLQKAIADGDAHALASLSEQLRPSGASDNNSGVPDAGSVAP